MKTFSELKAGDSVWIWWYTELYEYGVQDVVPIKTFLSTEEGRTELSPSGDLRILLKGGAEYPVYYYCVDSEAFVYGTDGPEYKIFGTSKEAVKKCLRDNLNKDAERLKDLTEKWLGEFDK